jgi:hypothetical protein
MGELGRFLRSLSWTLKCLSMISGAVLVLIGGMFFLGSVLPQTLLETKIYLALASVLLMICGFLPFIPNRWIACKTLYVVLYFSAMAVPWVALPTIGSVICGPKASFSLSCNETMVQLIVLMSVAFLAFLSLVIDLRLRQSG